MGKWTEAAQPIKEKLDTIDEVGGITKVSTQSDKIGFDFVNYYVNDVLVRQDYVEQDVPKGTADNPIVWADGMIPIDNAYYLVDGARKVYMGGEFIEF